MPGRILGSGVMACALDNRELAAAQPVETDPWAAQGAQVGPDSLQRPRCARGRALSCLAGRGTWLHLAGRPSCPWTGLLWEWSVSRGPGAAPARGRYFCTGVYPPVLEAFYGKECW